MFCVKKFAPFKGCTVLHVASLYNQLYLVDYFCSTFPELIHIYLSDEQQCSIEGETEPVFVQPGSDALMLAILANAQLVVDFYLDKNYYIDNASANGDNALKYSILVDNPKIYQNLSYVRAQLLMSDESGVNSFHFACYKPNMNVLVYLFDQAK